MKLEQQFKKAYVADSFAKQYENYVEIAENFAIGFAKFCLEENAILEDGKELLEIYKNTL